MGPSRHLVKFVECDGALWALKELPPRIAVTGVRRAAPAGGDGAQRGSARGSGVPAATSTRAILLTRYLDGLVAVPPAVHAAARRIAQAPRPAVRRDGPLLVELHRHGVFWGDCSLANTLFSRDGQVLQALLVDAETSEVHPHLSDGQRSSTSTSLVENVAAGLLDVAAKLERPELHAGTHRRSAEHQARYERLWELLHAEPTFGFADRYRVEGTIRKLNELGFAVDEVSLQPVAESTGGDRQLRLHVAVGDRRYHATQLRA